MAARLGEFALSRARRSFPCGEGFVNPSAGLLIAVTAVRVANPVPAPTARGKNSLGLFVGQAASPNCLRLFLHWAFRADFRGELMAGSNMADEDPDDRDDNQQFH